MRKYKMAFVRLGVLVLFDGAQPAQISVEHSFIDRGAGDCGPAKRIIGINAIR